jgi:hypothetical protein
MRSPSRSDIFGAKTRVPSAGQMHVRKRCRSADGGGVVDDFEEVDVPAGSLAHHGAAQFIAARINHAGARNESSSHARRSGARRISP